MTTFTVSWVGLGLFLYGYAIGTRVIEPPPPGTITRPGGGD